MRRKFPWIASAVMAAALSLAALPALAQELGGRYAVKGSAPGGGDAYDGTVTITRTGDVTFQVVWQIGSTRYVGTGIGSIKGLAVAYKSGGDTGIAIYSQSPDGMSGFWTWAGGKTVGEESWIKR